MAPLTGDSAAARPQQVTGGVFLFKYYEVNDAPVKNTEFVGIAFITGYMVCDSFTSNWQSRVFKQYSVGSITMMLYANLFSSAFTALGLVVTWEIGGVVTYLSENPGILYHILIMAICSAIGQLFIFHTIKTVSRTRPHAPVKTQCAIPGSNAPVRPQCASHDRRRCAHRQHTTKAACASGSYPPVPPLLHEQAAKRRHAPWCMLSPWRPCCPLQYGPLVFATIQTLRQLISIFNSIVQFGHPLVLMEGVGIGLVFFAISLQIFLKWRKKGQAAKKPSTPPLPVAADDSTSESPPTPPESFADKRSFDESSFEENTPIHKEVHRLIRKNTGGQIV
jgi:hypothetical protein